MTEQDSEDVATDVPTTDESTQDDNAVAGGTGYPFALSDEDRAEIEAEHGRLAIEDAIIVDEAQRLDPRSRTTSVPKMIRTDRTTFVDEEPTTALTSQSDDEEAE